MSKKKTKEEFEKQAHIVHNSKYNYSKVIYKGNRLKVKIICSNNHEFEQTPNAHILLKQGCPHCSGVFKNTTETFIKKAKEIHGNRYDYSLTNYVNATTKVEIICCKHGVFEQMARSHTNSKQGCTECGKSINGWTKNSFLNLCNKNNNRIRNFIRDSLLE